MDINEIIIEDIHQVERNFTLYDKIPYKNENIFIYINENPNGLEMVFLSYDSTTKELSEYIDEKDEIVNYYYGLNL